MALVLIVEDEKDLSALVEYNLRQAGFQTELASTGAEALAYCKTQLPDVVLLDVMLPDLSGKEVCRRLRADHRSKQLPVLMLTARGEEQDRIEGFEVGADDYVTKPFSPRELVLRLTALLRRTGPGREVADVLKLGPLTLDLAAHRGWVGEEEVELTALEFKLLLQLVQNVGRVQTRAQLLKDVWGFTSALETRTVDTHVMRLRDKLGEARALVETVRGIGYRMGDPATDKKP